MKKKREYLHILKGKDGKISGKRLLGTTLILAGIHIGYYGLFKDRDLSAIAVLCGTYFGAGLALWGITAWATNQQSANSSEIDETNPNKIDNPDE